MVYRNLKAGFKKCGIYPFDPNVIDQSKLKPSEMYSPINESLNSSNNVDASDSQKESSDESEDEVPKVCSRSLCIRENCSNA